MATGGAPFDALSSLDPETFAGESRAVINFLADYYRDVDTYPVQPQDLPGCLRALLPDAPPENGEPIDVILEEMAKWFEQELKADGRFEVVAPTRFSLVTFRLRPGHEGDGDAVDGLNRRLLVAMNASGRAFMTHFVVDGKFVIRMAVGGAMTEMRHVQDTWELVREKAEEVGALP
ncbi:unnamed protein product [Triticum turgidum subsp. durum]|uniref:Uncharacterized protein n=1 Tax=Triticum turgidum subsp. durum TaxID=4567 RepID=A0A9R0VS00_TRITD|nr:unnamed protein product [Triticum turgidum subsp. durum]